MSPLSFGERIRELRSEQEITQGELAEKMGISTAYISKIEKDRLAYPPSEDVLQSLAKFLKTDKEELLRLSGHIDGHALRRAAHDNYEVGLLLQKIQNGEINSDQIRKIVKELDS